MRNLLWLAPLFFFGCSSRTVETYEQRRESLISADRNLRFDRDIQLTTLESKVNDQFVALRDSMVAHYLEVGFFPPAKPFDDSKAHVELTPLFQLLRKMPKGGIHHLHGSAGIDFRWLVARAPELANCYVFWQEHPADFLKGEIRFFREAEVPEGFVLASELDVDPQFRDQLLDLLIFDEEPSSDTVKIWAEFERIFQRINGFFHYKPVFEEYTRSMVDTLRADGLHHVEVRTIFRGGLYDLDHDGTYYNADTVIQILKKVERDVQAEDPDFTLRSIYTFLRFLPEEQVFEELTRAYECRQRYPEMIVGFDLVANEDAGKSTYHFKSVWEKMDSLDREYQIQMPLFLHDGESDWAHVENLYDAYLLESQRIGHGFNLMHFPSLLPAIKEADICIEVSPLSNQILGYIQDLRVHPANYWLKAGIQCTINSDDPAIFNYNGLSYDFWHIALAWELDLRAIKKLAMNSITYSSLDDESRAKSLEAWSKKWDEFIIEADTLLTELSL